MKKYRKRLVLKKEVKNFIKDLALEALELILILMLVKVIVIAYVLMF